MLIGTFKTYYPVAKIEFDTFYGDEVECIIKGLFQPTEPVQVFKAKGNPLTITMKESSDDTFAPIKTSEAILNVHNLTDFQALGILAKGNRDYQLEITYNGTIIWTGFMVPDQWSEPFTAVPYPSEFTFIDGLSMLKNEPFVDDTGCYYRGRRRDYITVGFILSKIGLNRSFVDQINIVDVNAATLPIPESTLVQKFKDLESFRDDSCYDVLEKILRSHVARIEFFNNKYYIRRVRENTQLIKSHQFNMVTGSPPISQGSTEYTNIVDVTCPTSPTRLAWVENTQELYRLPGVKTLTINQDYGRKESIIPRSLFSDCDWQNETNLRFWNGNGIKRTVVDDETCVEFRAWTPATNPYTKPAYIEMTMDDVYDVTGIDATNADLFELDIIARNGTYIPNTINPYIGHRRSSGSTTGMGRSVAPATNEFRGTETLEVTVNISSSDGLPYFTMGKSFFDDRGLPYPTGGERFLFRDVDNLPIGYDAGLSYIVDVYFETSGLPLIFFLLQDSTNPFASKRPDADDDELTFDAAFFWTRLPVEFGFDGNIMDALGAFLTFGYLDIEISRRDLENRRFISTGTESTTGLTSALYSTGPMSLKIYKPTEANIETRGQDGTFFIESVKLTIKDTPEGKTEKILLNENNNVDREINIFFAETPIKNNFRNNNLKYYNNFYSRSTINAPGLQKIDYIDTTIVQIQRTMYSWIVSDHITLMINPRFALTGTLESPDTSPFGKILGESYSNKNYIMTSCNYNVYLHRYEGEWHEIGIYNQEPQLGSYSDAYSDAYDN